jgi:hypothetical protein
MDAQGAALRAWSCLAWTQGAALRVGLALRWRSGHDARCVVLPGVALRARHSVRGLARCKRPGCALRGWSRSALALRARRSVLGLAWRGAQGAALGAWSCSVWTPRVRHSAIGLARRWRSGRGVERQALLGVALRAQRSVRAWTCSVSPSRCGTRCFVLVRPLALAGEALAAWLLLGAWRWRFSDCDERRVATLACNVARLTWRVTRAMRAGSASHSRSPSFMRYFVRYTVRSVHRHWICGKTTEIT